MLVFAGQILPNSKHESTLYKFIIFVDSQIYILECMLNLIWISHNFLYFLTFVIDHVHLTLSEGDDPPCIYPVSYIAWKKVLI